MGKKKRVSPADQESSFQRVERPLSLTAQVERKLRKGIADGLFPNGRLPTAVELAEQLGVSRETVRLALDALQHEGLIVKHRRRGTFINTHAEPPDLKRAPSRILGYLQADYTPEKGESEVVTRATSSFLFDGALVEAGNAGYQLLVRSTRICRLRDAFTELKAHGPIEGAIFASIAEEKFLRRLTGLGLPCVLLDHDLHLPQMSSIHGDDHGRAKLAVQQLVASGHRRIALANWRQDDLNPWFSRGFRESMRDAGLRCRKAWELSVELNSTGAKQAVQAIVNMSPRPTAIICFHNTFAHEFIKQAKSMGLNTPDDISVIGGGGESVVGLTCTQIDWYEMGRIAMKMLLNAIESGDDYECEHRLATATWQDGDTVAPDKAG